MSFIIFLEVGMLYATVREALNFIGQVTIRLILPKAAGDILAVRLWRCVLIFWNRLQKFAALVLFT